ncbi:HesA/MoeB/ThiF family protein [Elizabethkingia bruuniana]|uniref:HesA/MoeB/ThiF family protein n=1 Tax=Elizabethkingia bruuniana TaxID=1756149 RepID=A0A7T7ZXQ9_9FLAO|nr:HesA/MoeB/ThiF family protein [Elizabethkingia bruuniana]KGO10944.1 thiamine biosynthesis protein [Elizabethkingia miricola]AQX84868.1 thiamine biosynthesis protein [Elizabethkingia bruuniana]KUY28949.1 thiamine biosynthesis protein [Elizabethkingia bruuniana]OPB70578.1 thiamine biosynthesis protein [Elizabethkingia bruuniana]QDZ62654.1 thiamine biosynthesis protein [Elizabethkingia bruuniana]
MEDNFERYQCQITLPGFGISSQQLLENARVLIVGMGGLGCPSAQYLVSSGIGTIGIADDDTVSLSNLHRQILYTPEDTGLPKVEVAARRLQQQNPSVNIIPYNLRVTSENIINLISEYDLIIEGTDNFETKYLLNDACVLTGKPLIYGAIYQYEGQVSIWNVLQNDGMYSPNYRDVFPDVETSQIPNCREGGVIPTLAGITGCMQANEAIKYITGSEDLLAGKLWMLNVITGKTQVIKLKKSTAFQITDLVQTIPLITFEQLRERKDYFEIIDVRTEKEHHTFNIGGKNIPVEKLQDQLNNISSVLQPILLYCQSGKRSMEAAEKIKKAFPNKEVFSLKDGINNIPW